MRPNSGYWYIATRPSFRMHRSISYRDDLVPGTLLHVVADPIQRQQCLNGDTTLVPNPAGDLLVTLRQLNGCLGYGTAFSEYVTAMMKHEGFGDPARGLPGHESLGRAAALREDGDPLHAIERIVGPNEAELRRRAHAALRNVATTLSSATSHTVGNGFGHWTGDIWVHKPDFSGFKLDTREP